MHRKREFLYMLRRICIEISDIVFGRNPTHCRSRSSDSSMGSFRNLMGEAMPGTYVNGVSPRTFRNTKSSKRLRHPGGSDLNQLPYCYIRPSAKLAVKPANWWLRPNLNGAPGQIARGCAAHPPLRAPDRRRCSGDVQPGAAPGSRTDLLPVRGSICFRSRGQGRRRTF
jgi:hypothetical protein